MGRHFLDARQKTVKLPAAELPRFQGRLLQWFHCHRRDLPWRHTHDPYRIWLSEVMLQQTRVAAALPFYRRFLEQFPTLRALARARIQQVLRLWAGLGYYSRARHLHRAAKEIVARHSGQFPRELKAARCLPGVGTYTAAAVLSIAYNEPHAVLDGNVARVLARLFAVRSDLRAPHQWRKLQDAAQRLVAFRAPREWNQAMMELGATLCTPRAPRCTVCPVAPWCRAYALGATDNLPSPRKKRRPEPIQLAAAVLLDARGRTLLVSETTEAHAALFSRLWQFPATRVFGDARQELARYLCSRFPGKGFSKDGSSLVPLPAARHSVTYRQITLLPFLLPVPRVPRAKAARVCRLARLDQLAVSNATRKIAAAALRAWVSKA